jgi:hypothetical protein
LFAPRWLVAALLIPGCDSVFGLRDVPLATDAHPCTWSEPRQLPTFTGSDHDPEQRFDRLELIYKHTEGPLHTIYHATRATAQDDYGAPAPLITPVSTDDHDPALSGDGLHLFFVANSAIEEVVRPSLDGSFGPPVVRTTGLPGIAGVSTASSDGKWLYCVTSHTNLVFELDRVERASASDDYGGAVPAGTNIYDPSVTRDELAVFASPFPSTMVVRRTRATTSDVFPEDADELIATGSAPSISLDGSSLIYETTSGFAELDRTCQ